jgi:hypothetical protein
MALFLLVLPLSVAVLSIWHRHLRDAKRLRLREMIHAERMRALEKGLPPQANGGAELDEGLGAGARPGGDLARLRLLALFVGLVGIFGGAGLSLWLWVVVTWRHPGHWTSMSWLLGLIPVLIGVGLLLFVYLSRGVARSPSAGQTARERGGGDRG